MLTIDMAFRLRCLRGLALCPTVDGEYETPRLEEMMTEYQQVFNKLSDLDDELVHLYNESRGQ